MNDGNRTRAAWQLGISVWTLQYRLKEYGMLTEKQRLVTRPARLHRRV